MAEALIGSWDFDSVEGLDEYMKASGLPEEMKEAAKDTKPKVDISKDGENWVIKTTLGDKSMDNTFQIGTEIETKNILGKPMQTTLTLTDSGLLETQKAGPMVFTVERSAQDGVMTSKMSVNGVTATAKFVKVWKEGTSLDKKLFGSLEDLQYTAAFIEKTSLAI